jgi:hypothetical protein
LGIHEVIDDRYLRRFPSDLDVGEELTDIRHDGRIEVRGSERGCRMERRDHRDVEQRRHLRTPDT